jgi:hypothetical protein
MIIAGLVFAVLETSLPERTSAAVLGASFPLARGSHVIHLRGRRMLSAEMEKG